MKTHFIVCALRAHTHARLSIHTGGAALGVAAGLGVGHQCADVLAVASLVKYSLHDSMSERDPREWEREIGKPLRCPRCGEGYGANYERYVRLVPCGHTLHCKTCVEREYLQKPCLACGVVITGTAVAYEMLD